MAGCNPGGGRPGRLAATTGVRSIIAAQFVSFAMAVALIRPCALLILPDAVLGSF